MRTFLDLEPDEFEYYWQEYPELNELEIVELWAKENGLLSSNRDVVQIFNTNVMPEIIAKLPMSVVIELVVEGKTYDKASKLFLDFLDSLYESGQIHRMQARRYTYG